MRRVGAGRAAGCDTVPAAGTSGAAGRGRRAPRARSRRASPRTGRSGRLADLEALLQPRDDLVGGRLATISSRTTSPNRRRRSFGLDRLEQVVGLVGDLEVGIARDAEHAALRDLDAREERRQVLRDHVLDRQQRPVSLEAQEAGQALGDFEPREALLVRARGRGRARRRRARGGETYGNDWPGPTASGVSTGKISRSNLRSSALEVARREVVDGADRRSPRRRAPGEAPRPTASTAHASGRAPARGSRRALPAAGAHPSSASAGRTSPGRAARRHGS